MSFRIVAKKFTPDEFDAYVAGALKPQLWVRRIVLHNTAAPSLAQRPGGILTAQHIDNLHTYYSKTKKWSGGPHLFVDATGIWVFNPLNDPGVHSPSYNSNSWGVEMLGNYETESFTSGLGAKVRENALRACAALARNQQWNDLQAGRLILHKEDPATDHDCPGKNVNKADFVAAASALISKPKAPTLKLVVAGKAVDGAFVKDGVSYAPVRALGEALGAKVEFDPKTNTITVNK
jgi:hypothetical protein